MIQKGTKVFISYAMKDETQTVWAQAGEAEPMEVIVGSGQLAEPVEKALLGKQSGDELSIELPFEQGYGAYDESLVRTLPISHFEGIDLKVGQRFYPTLDKDVGFEVKAIDHDEVTIDGNHPLAGKTLTFEIKILKTQA